MRRSLTNYKGYSLVELIIVLAIIVVLVVLSLISLTILKTARAKDACIQVGSEITELKMRSMNMTPNDSIHDSYALAIYKGSSDGKFHIAQVLHKKDGSGYDIVSSEDRPISSSVEIKFSGNAEGLSNPKSEWVPGSWGGSGDDGPLIIAYDKRGNCYSGNGNIIFYKTNGNKVSRIELGITGKIDVR